MKLFKLFSIFAFLLLVAFAANILAQKPKAKSSKLILGNNDKKEIIRQVFDEGFEKLISSKNFYQCLIPIVGEVKIILIETTDSKLFPKKLGEYSFKFLSRAEINNEVKSNNGECWFDLTLFQPKNSKTVKLTLWRWIRVITVVNGKSWYPSGWVYADGLVYEAAEINGKWKVKFLKKTAIVS